VPFVWIFKCHFLVGVLAGKLHCQCVECPFLVELHLEHLLNDLHCVGAPSLISQEKSDH
jgi:hypothetical protein